MFSFISMVDQEFIADYPIEPHTFQQRLGNRQAVADNNNLNCWDTPKSHGAELVQQTAAEQGSQVEIEINPTNRFDLEALYLEASEIAGQRLTADQKLVMALANQMSYEDLHPTTKAKVDEVFSTSETNLEIQRIAAKLLNQYRRQMGTA